MTNVVVTTPEQLASLIDQSVRKALAEQSPQQGRQFQSHEYLSIEEASEYLHLPKNTLYNYCHNNVIPFYKRGKYNYFLKSDLDIWLASGRKKTVKEMGKEALSQLSRKGGVR